MTYATICIQIAANSCDRSWVDKTIKEQIISFQHMQSFIAYEDIYIAMRPQSMVG